MFVYLFRFGFTLASREFSEAKIFDEIMMKPREMKRIPSWQTSLLSDLDGIEGLTLINRNKFSEISDPFLDYGCSS